MERKKPVFERDSGPTEANQSKPDVVITRLINDTFRPTEAQRRAKSALLAALSDPTCAIFEVKTISAAQAATLCSNDSVLSWWKQPGFKAWFLNKDETRQKIKYLTDKALESVTQVLEDPDPRASASKVAILKILLQYEAAEIQTKTNTRFDSMDITQLRAFLKQNAHLIRPLLEETKPATLESAEEFEEDATGITTEDSD